MPGPRRAAQLALLGLLLVAVGVQAGKQQQEELAPAIRIHPLYSSLSRRHPDASKLLLNSTAEGQGNKGLDDVATIFSQQGIARTLPQLAQRLQEQEDGPPLSLDRAKVMAKLTSIAYCSDATVIQTWKCTRCLRVPDFKPQEVVFDTAWDVLAYVGYDPTADAAVVVFRGTDSANWGNWINNLKTWRQNQMYPIPGSPRALVHAGFYRLWTASALQANVTRAVQDIMAAHPKLTRLHVTGHSMGGALASLSALDLRFHLNFTDVRVWSFGSPRVGNVGWQALFNEHVDESWRFTHNRDVVPSLPPQLMGFHHVAREAWTVDVELPGGVEEKVLVCDSTGEDPSCHNSACLLGLCTSVADHLTYLGIEMYKDPMEC